MTEDKTPLYWRLVPVHKEPGEDSPTGFAFCMGTARFVSTREPGPVLSNEAVEEIRRGKLVPDPTPGREKFLLNMVSQIRDVLVCGEGTPEQRYAVACELSINALRWDSWGRKRRAA